MTNLKIQSKQIKRLEEKMTLKTIPHTQSVTEIEQHPQMKELSIAELMAQHMNEEKQKATMFYEE